MNKAGKKDKKKRDKEFVAYGVINKFRQGFGFIEPDEETRTRLSRYFGDDMRDIYVAAGDMNGAMDGDKVEAVILPSYFWRGKRPEGSVSRVTERKLKEVVGTLRKRKKFGYVIPENIKLQDWIYVSEKHFNGAADGDKVVCSIIKYPSDSYQKNERKSEGEITEIVAKRAEKGADIKALIRAYGYSNKFPEAAARMAKNVAAGGISWKENDRKDIRNKKVFTIDGADSKDFDDAVSVEKLDNGNYLLGVHIADVSEYVTEKSPLDKEALKRGTSVYLIDWVVPMLPEELSNDICSLNPGKDRLTLSVDMEIDSNGDVKEYEIYKSVIRSSFRLIYDDVSDMIEAPETEESDIIERAEVFKKKYYDIYDDIMSMAELARILRKKRKKRGSLDFDIDEAQIQLDKSGMAVYVGIAERRSANKLIEEFMLLANETVARHFAFMELPFVYRVHEKPAADKMEELKAFMRSFGINLGVNADNVHPKMLAEILENIKGTQYENVVSSVMLRSMQKAVYETECMGHYGLALKYYCHFTSPIRRYPDLIIHRIIKETLGGFPNEERIKELTVKAREAAELSSLNEKRAVELERDVEKLKKAEYMTMHIGEISEGVISGVSNYGIYVTLPNTVEGLVRLEWLNDDFYDCEREKYRVVGRATGNTYSLGESVVVKVKNASPELRETDFVLLRKAHKQ